MYVVHTELNVQYMFICFLLYELQKTDLSLRNFANEEG